MVSRRATGRADRGSGRGRSSSLGRHQTWNRDRDLALNRRTATLYVKIVRIYLKAATLRVLAENLNVMLHFYPKALYPEALV